MKQETVYKCEICNQIYEDREACERCEKSHKVSQETTSSEDKTKHGSPYPDKLQIKWEDGVVVDYVLKKLEPAEGHPEKNPTALKIKDMRYSKLAVDTNGHPDTAFVTFDDGSRATHVQG